MSGRAGGVARPAALLFAIMVAHALLETARDVLFLGRLGPARLPWAYLAIAALSGLIVVGARRAGGARDPRRLLRGLLTLAAGGTGGFAILVALTPAAVFALYLWTGAIAAALMPAFWVVVDRGRGPAEARRAFARIGAGGGIGALVGFAAAALLGAHLAPGWLILLAAAGFAAAGALAVGWDPGADRAPARVRPARLDRRDATRRARRYLRLLLALALIATVALTFADLAFKRALAERLPAADLPVVLGATYAALNLLALLVQLGLTGRLLDRVGVGGALAILPGAILVAALALSLSGALAAVVALKLADGALRHSVHRVAGEILYLPMGGAARARAKHAVEIVGQRGGQAVAALLVLAIGGLGGWTPGALTAGAAALWLAGVGLVRGAYLRQLRDRLELGELQRSGALPRLDASSAALLGASLASPDEAEALAAVDLLAAGGSRIPALVLYHPSAAVVRRALAALHGEVRDDVVRVLEHLTGHPDPTIRAAALAAASRTGCHHPRLLAALDDPDPDVRATAAIGLSGMTCPAAPAALLHLEAMRAGGADERGALARAIGRARDPRHGVLLRDLTTRREPAVVREVLAVWEDLPQLADVDVLIELLGDPHLRGPARRVLAAGGDRHQARLAEALADPRTPLGVRRHLPRTLAGLRGPGAAAALVARLLHEPDGTTEFKLLRALGRLRADQPTLAIDPVPLRAYLRRTIDDAARYQAFADALAGEPAWPGAELLRELLADKRAHAIERAFRALGVLRPTDELRLVHAALTGDDDDRRGAARELLEHSLPDELRRPLLALLDHRGAPGAVPAPRGAVLAAMLRDGSESLRCLAAHHVAERHLVALRPELVRLRPTAGSALVTRAFDQAIARLDAGP